MSQGDSSLILPLSSGGNGTGSNGNITLISGQSGSTQYTGTLSSTGGSGTAGAITISTATPDVGAGITINNGAITSGNVSVGATQASNVTLTGNTIASGILSVTSGTTNAITVNSGVSASGNSVSLNNTYAK